MKEIRKAENGNQTDNNNQKTYTLRELRQDVGRIVREVHFSGKPANVTDYGRKLVEIKPA